MVRAVLKADGGGERPYGQKSIGRPQRNCDKSPDRRHSPRQEAARLSGIIHGERWALAQWFFGTEVPSQATANAEGHAGAKTILLRCLLLQWHKHHPAYAGRSP